MVQLTIRLKWSILSFDVWFLHVSKLANTKWNQGLKMAIDEYLSNPNESQRAAACFERKNLLVLAGAGTGKTRTIIARAAYLISQGVDPARTQIVTFPRKAAFEIKTRVQAILPDQCEGLTSSTFHSWCAKLQHSFHVFS